MRLDVSNLMNLLSEYEIDELDDMGKSVLKDELLDLSQQLSKEGVDEGWRYEFMMIHVPEGGELPNLYEEMTFSSPLTGGTKKRFIKEIVGLKRNHKGELIVEAIAKKVGP